MIIMYDLEFILDSVYKIFVKSKLCKNCTKLLIYNYNLVTVTCS